MRAKGRYEKTLIISCIVIIGFFMLIMRLWQLQILEGGKYKKLSEANRFRVMRIPSPRGILFDRNGIPLVKNAPCYCASIICGEFDMSRVDALSKVLKMSVDEILEKIKQEEQGPFTPLRLKEGLSFDEVEYIESRRSDFPGLIIETEFSREYIYGPIGSHLIGYLGKINPDQIKDPKFQDVPPDAFIGQWGAELLFDKSLRGKPGKKVIEVDALGREIRLLSVSPPRKGNDITLSLDIHLQEAAEEAFGGRAGALVAVKPDTGEVLGLVSKPSFDPNLFSRGIDYDEWVALSQGPGKPFLNRALQSQFPPGSTFKIIMAIAGLEEGVITPSTKVDCKGGISYGRWHFGCWRNEGHGILSLYRAIVESCDVYFYEVGKRLGIDKIYEYATSFGFGKETGFKLVKERCGFVPNTEWKREKKRQPWYIGETFNTAIGQGYISATPIQMAVMMGAIANGGYLYKPTLVTGVKPVILGKAKVSDATLEIVKKAMYGVVNDYRGTGWAAKSQFTTIAGKTGTAQVIAKSASAQHLSERFRDHAWFIAFAPFERPEVALAVFVEHGGHGGTAAAPIARKAIEGYIRNVGHRSQAG